MDYEKSGVIREMEIEKFNDLDKFGHFIDSTTFCHLKWCQHSFCSNCTITDKITDVYIENFHNEEDGVNNLFLMG